MQTSPNSPPGDWNLPGKRVSPEHRAHSSGLGSQGGSMVKKAGSQLHTEDIQVCL